jgi:hypothetical protein
MCLYMFVHVHIVRRASFSVPLTDGGNGHGLRGVQVTDGDGLSFVSIVSYDAFC